MIDPSILQTLQSWSPGMIYLAATIILWRQMLRDRSEYRTQYNALLERYEVLLTKAVEGLVRTEERLDDLQKRP